MMRLRIIQALFLVPFLSWPSHAHQAVSSTTAGTLISHTLSRDRALSILVGFKGDFLAEGAAAFDEVDCISLYSYYLSNSYRSPVSEFLSLGGVPMKGFKITVM